MPVQPQPQHLNARCFFPLGCWAVGILLHTPGHILCLHAPKTRSRRLEDLSRLQLDLPSPLPHQRTMSKCELCDGEGIKGTACPTCGHPPKPTEDEKSDDHPQSHALIRQTGISHLPYRLSSAMVLLIPFRREKGMKLVRLLFEKRHADSEGMVYSWLPINDFCFSY